MGGCDVNGPGGIEACSKPPEIKPFSQLIDLVQNLYANNLLTDKQVETIQNTYNVGEDKEKNFNEEFKLVQQKFPNGNDLGGFRTIVLTKIDGTKIEIKPEEGAVKKDPVCKNTDKPMVAIPAQDSFDFGFFSRDLNQFSENNLISGIWEDKEGFYDHCGNPITGGSNKYGEATTVRKDILDKVNEEREKNGKSK